MTDSAHHEGGCLCGAVRYHGQLAPDQTATHCFCRMCRKANGGVFVTWVALSSASFSFSHGDPHRFRSSDLAERSFCGTCGGALTFHSIGDPKGPPGVIWAALGSLDRPEEIVPTHHIFAADKPAWLELDDNLPRYPSQLPWIRTQDELARPTVSNDDPVPVSSGKDDTLEGGCLCGAIHYHAIRKSSPPATTCHCSICRKTTGATLFGSADFTVADVTFTGGQPRRYRSSGKAERAFCGTCGCHLTFRFVDDPGDGLSLTIGSMDRPEAIRPTVQLFVADGLPWLRLKGDMTDWPQGRQANTAAQGESPTS
ncbi:MAG: hypothetical protein CMM46_07545 [Rhodospirillaceae bacterium]|nr:hypothetical protein [Rhodospirillaceae bacterium]|tara:strand:- start:16362 stop:17297 length:936 start_codon:yes stop_codon:yes gene_type:complete